MGFPVWAFVTTPNSFPANIEGGAIKRKMREKRITVMNFLFKNGFTFNFNVIDTVDIREESHLLLNLKRPFT